MVNSAQFDGTPNKEGIGKVAEFLKKRAGETNSQLQTARLADFATEILGRTDTDDLLPEMRIVPVPEEELPVLLPEDAEFKPTGESPLKYCSSFVIPPAPNAAGRQKRETDTMDTFMCSSWYFLRYANAHIDTAAFDKEAVKYWLPVDLYTECRACRHAPVLRRVFTKAIR